MKTYLISLLALCVSFSVFAQEQISLSKPDMSLKTSLMQSLSERKSTREFSTKALPTEVLSNVLWAANGVNRAVDKKRTAPSAMNRQDVEIYVCMAKGAYRYDAFKNVLIKVSDKDLRKAVAGSQSWSADAPVSLLLVSDVSKLGGSEATGHLDAGYVSQNICLYCAAAGLATVPRGTMDRETLKTALKLPDSHKMVVNHPVGYSK